MRRLFRCGLLLVSPFLLAAALSAAELVSVDALMAAADRRDPADPAWAAALAQDNPVLLQAAARGLGRIGGDERLAQLLPLLGHAEPAVRAEAAFAIAILETRGPAVQAEQERALALRLTLEPDALVRQQLLRALGNCGGDRSQQLLRDYRIDHLGADERAAWAQAVGLLWSYRRGALSGLDAALVARLLGVLDRAEPVAEMAAFALARARKEPLVQAQAAALKAAFGRSRSAGARIFLLRALASDVTEKTAKRWLRIQQQQRLAGRALHAAERMELNALLAANLPMPALRSAVAHGLRSAAAAERLAILQALTGRPVEAQALRDLLQAHAALQPADQRWLQDLLEPAQVTATTETEADPEPAAATSAYAEALAYVGLRYRLHTVRGVVDIELLPEAVYTVANFARLADKGYYDRSTFHRVIGNFVAQGGDPSGTGEGGPGWRIREELSPLPHAPGYVGMATAGKDTAGSQFFINTGRNPHLDWHYTIFARVIAGQAVAQQLLPGDALLAVRRLP
ncbi:MAG TPA: peptidylprolyl isomerase [Permianibacter sp.]|nr:peptidylprolyl isomerase [Permianibacter sp.]